MSQTAPLHAETTTEAVGESLTGDARMQSRRELRIATRLLIGVVLVVVFVAVLFVLFGPAVLGIVGLGATLAVFAILIAYAAGF